MQGLELGLVHAQPLKIPDPYTYGSVRVPCELEVEEGPAPSALDCTEPHSKQPTSLASIKVTFPYGPGRQVVSRTTLDSEAYTVAILGHFGR